MSMSPRPPIPSFIPESAPFTPEQRTWLNGLFAGVFGLQEGVTPLSPADAAKLLPGLLDFGGRDWQAVWEGAQENDHPPPGTGALRVPRRDPVPVDLHWQHLTDGGDVELFEPPR